MEKVIRCLDIAELAQAEAALFAHKIKKRVYIWKKDLPNKIFLNPLDDSDAALLGDSQGLLNFQVHDGDIDYQTKIGVYVGKLAGRFAVHIVVEFDCYNEKKMFNKMFLERVPRAKRVKIKKAEHIVYEGISLKRSIDIDYIVNAIIEVSYIVKNLMTRHCEHGLNKE